MLPGASGASTAIINLEATPTTHRIMQIVLSELKAVKPATANAQPIRAETVMTMPGK